MIKLENIDKLNGVKIGDWTCYMVEERKDHYVISFESATTTGVITEFRLYKEDKIRGLWTLRGKMDVRNMVVSQFQTNSISDTQAISKDEFQTFDAFCRTLAKTLKKFDGISKYGISTYGTSSLASKPRMYNPQQPHPHLGSAASVASVTKDINGGEPDWYVPKEEVKMPTIWETFKEMIGWDKWINILFPMKQTIEQVIPKKKKITAKKAAY